MPNLTRITGKELMERILAGETDFSHTTLSGDRNLSKLDKKDLFSEEYMQLLSYLGRRDSKPIIAKYSDWRGLVAERLNLSKAVFDGSNLSGSQLQFMNLELSSFKRAILKDVKLIGSMCRNADFSGAILSKSILSGHFGTANFKDAELSGSSFYNAHMRGCNFQNANLKNSLFLTLIKPNHDLTSYKRSYLALVISLLGSLPNDLLDELETTAADNFLRLMKNFASKTKAWPAGTLRYGVFDPTLRGSDFRNAAISSAKFFGIDLRHAIMIGTDLHSAQFRFCNLQNVNFTNAKLLRAHFEYCNLSQSDLSKNKIAAAKLDAVSEFTLKREMYH